MFVDVFYMMIIFVIWHDFDDATMWYEYIDIYIYIKFYKMIYVRVSTLVLRIYTWYFMVMFT